MPIPDVLYRFPSKASGVWAFRPARCAPVLQGREPHTILESGITDSPARIAQAKPNKTRGVPQKDVARVRVCVASAAVPSLALPRSGVGSATLCGGALSRAAPSSPRVSHSRMRLISIDLHAQAAPSRRIVPAHRNGARCCARCKAAVHRRVAPHLLTARGCNPRQERAHMMRIPSTDGGECRH